MTVAACSAVVAYGVSVSRAAKQHACGFFCCARGETAKTAYAARHGFVSRTASAYPVRHISVAAQKNGEKESAANNIQARNMAARGAVAEEQA